MKNGNYTHADYREAHSDLMARAFGLPVREPHPLAATVLRDGGCKEFYQIAESVLETHGQSIDQFHSDPYRPIIQAMATTSDFPEIVRNTLVTAMQARTSPTLENKINPLVRQLELENYRDESFALVDLRDLPLANAHTTNRFHTLKTLVSGQAIRVHSLNANLVVPVQLAVSSPEQFILAAAAAFQDRCHAGELAQGIVALLESNPTMPDGVALFHADHANIASAPLETGHPQALGTVFSTLRNQKNEGGTVSDADPAVLLCHADDEVVALNVVETLPENQRPRVIATAHLTDDSAWFLFASPETHPVIARSRMRGAPLSAISADMPGPAFEVTEENERKDFPGFMVPFRHTIGYSLLSHVGVVRVTKTA